MATIKSFEDFLDRMQGLLDNAKKQGHIIVRVEDLENAFPELAESEDKRIRRVIRGWIYTRPASFFDNGISKEDMIAWLETQSEKNTVKPKYHEGDWIVHNVAKFVFQIVGVGTYGYNVVNREGYAKTISLSNEENYHLWTIKDAKGGDVVVDKSDGAIGIFQSIGHHPDGGSYNDPSYCFLHCHYEEGFFFEHGCTIDSDDLIPATKEQRDTLMKAMVNAGYTFDFEKKEPKKIEQKFNIGDEIKTANEEPLAITKIDEKGYWSEDLFICDFDDAAKWEIVEQKPAWSKEDEKMALGIEQVMQCASLLNIVPDKIEKVRDWLNSLKKRVQPKQEWSEEDEYTLGETIQHLEELIRIDKAKHCACDVQYYQRDIDWLKNLKERYTWKPSEEQMNALANALSLAKNCGEECSFDLRTLYEQLKKLKG